MNQDDSGVSRPASATYHAQNAASKILDHQEKNTRDRISLKRTGDNSKCATGDQAVVVTSEEVGGQQYECKHKEEED